MALKLENEVNRGVIGQKKLKVSAHTTFYLITKCTTML